MSRTTCAFLFAFCACIAVFAAAALGQAEKHQTWAQDIAYLQQLTPAQAVSQASTIIEIHNGVQLWIKSHPESELTIAAPPARPLTAGTATAEIKQLDRVINAIIAQDPLHPFHLGTVTVNVTAQIAPISPLSDTIDATEIAKRNEYNAALAMEYLPGVSVTHTYSGRNQQQVSVHGFGYLQVPLYVDGILMNDPYDGTLDFRQIPTTDIAEIQVAKGFSSPLLGPNAAGGAINVVSKEPQKKYEGEMMTGGYSGAGFLSSLRLGSRLNKFFLEGSLDWQQDNYIPLSGNFATDVAQPNDQLNYSASHNAKYSGRIGWTPSARSEYVFTYLNQKANDPMPLNTGNDPLNGDSCSPTTLTSATLYSCYSNTGGKYGFREWSFWDKTSYYFHSDTGLGQSNSLKVRVYYDQYPNLMSFYIVPSSITAPPVYTPAMWVAGESNDTLYSDHSDGFAAELDSTAVRRNAIGLSFYFKDDTHKEVPLLPPASTLPQYGLDRQQIASIGAQDVVTLAENLTATVGFSADHIDGLRAVDSNNSYRAFVSPQCPSNTSNSDVTACTPHQWAYNPQVSVAYAFKDSGRLFVGFAQKSRFPGMKELYSYKMGKGIPNPTLETEHSQNWEIGYSRKFAGSTLAQLEFFRSGLVNAIESIPAPSSVEALYPSSVCSNPASCSIEENASHETHQGAELTVHSAPVQRVTFDANYTYVNKEIDGYSFQGAAIGFSYPCGNGDYLVAGTGASAVQTTLADNTCLTPTDLPKHKAVGTATLRLPLQAMLNSTLRYEGGNKAIDSYTASKKYYEEAVGMSHFATWDLGGSVPIYKGATLQAGVRNLLDRNYYQVLYIPEEGRNWFVNMRYHF